MDMGKCDMCDFHEIIHRCETCSFSLCSRCSISHTRAKATDTHILKEITDNGTRTTVTPAEATSSEPVPTFCLTHKDQQISIFCSTCNDIICQLCQKKSHINHKTYDVEDSKMKLQGLALDFIRRLFDAKSAIRTDDEELKSRKDNTIHTLQQMKTELAARKDELFKNINETYDKSTSQIHSDQTRIQQQFDKITTERKDSIQKSQELDTELVSVRNSDDVSSLLCALINFKYVYPSIKQVAAQSATNEMCTNCEGLLQSEDSSDGVLWPIRQYLALKNNVQGEYSEQGIKNDTLIPKSTPTSGARPKTTDLLDDTRADNIKDYPLDMAMLTPRSGTQRSPQSNYSTQDNENSTPLPKTTPTLGARPKPGNLFGNTSADNCTSFMLDMAKDPRRPGKQNSQQVQNTTQMAPSSNVCTEFTVVYKGVTIVVKEGNIADENVGCVVHGYKVISSTKQATKISLLDPIGKLLVQKAGNMFKEICEREYMLSGSSVITPGASTFDKVLHIDTTPYALYGRPNWESFIVRCLQKAERDSIKSISFPFIGSVATAEIQKLAKVQIYGVKTYINSGTLLEEIRFVINDDAVVLKAFKDSIEAIIGSSEHEGASVRATIVPTKSAEIKHVVTLNGSYGELDMTIVRGDLTKETTDCIVHSTQNPISFNGQSGRALKDAGGPKFEKACDSASFGMFTNKNTVLTNAGSLPCKQVLHLAMPTAQGLFDNKLKMVTAYVLECLHVANDEKIKSISFPALGTGQWRCKPAEVAKCFETAINKFNSKRTKGHLNEIRLVVFEQLMMDEFTDEYRNPYHNDNIWIK